MKYVGFLLLLGMHLSVFSQAKTRKLPTAINHPAINHYAPYMSFDGDAIVYLSDNAEDYAIVPFFSYREGGSDWKEPVPLPKNLFTRLNFLRGFTLGPEGKILLFSTLKSPGVGGFDLWVSERKGTSWGEPKNMSAPINSKSHEACATITTDGKTIYFMRCDVMDQKSASGCKIFVAQKRSNGSWEEPVELSSTINTGNSQAPRILADGETLIFSSDKFPGGKGGMDLYVSRLKDGQWSTPLPLDFVNTPKDDQFVSVNGVGRYLLRDAPGGRKNELVEYLIPDHLRPRGLTRVDGKVTDPNGGAVSSYISVLDLESSKRIFNGRPASDGSFTLFLLEGGKYDLSIDPEFSNISFYSQRFDLTQGDIPQVEKVKAVLKPVEDQDELDLNLVSFKPYTSELMPSSEDELKRLARIIKGKPDMHFELQVLLAGYMQDSIQSNEDLTEILYDSIAETIDDIDSLGQLVQRDTMIVEVSYHNDRTIPQAENLIDFLVRQGIAADRLKYFVNARPEAVEENKKTTVRVRVLKN